MRLNGTVIIIIVKFFTQLLQGHRKVSVLKGICCSVPKNTRCMGGPDFRLELTRSKVAERSACMQLAPWETELFKG